MGLLQRMFGKATIDPSVQVALDIIDKQTSIIDNIQPDIKEAELTYFRAMLMSWNKKLEVLVDQAKLKPEDYILITQRHKVMIAKYYERTLDRKPGFYPTNSAA